MWSALEKYDFAVYQELMKLDYSFAAENDIHVLRKTEASFLFIIRLNPGQNY